MPMGGAERVLIDIFRYIDYSKYIIDLLLYNNEGALLNQIDKHVGLIYLYQKPKYFLIYRIKWKIKRVLCLIDVFDKLLINRKVCKDYDCIISFCQGLAHKMHVHLLMRQSTHISWVHSDLSKDNWGKLYFDGNIHKQEAAYNKMDKIIFVSKGAHKAFNQVFCIHANVKQIVCYNILDITNIRKSALNLRVNKPAGKFIFINIGRLIDAKKQIRIIEASKLLSEITEAFEVWILGDGLLKETLQEKIMEYKLENQVKLLGYIENPYPYLIASDTFILTSSQEGFSLVLCEALVLGIPTISTKVVGPIELLDGSRYGLLIDDSIEIIMNAMLTIMTNSEIRNHYAKMALERSNIFDIPKTMADIYSIID